ncbi:hypothetical protein GCM10017673_34500 [Streptosporangium violaceochromogenes]|nr:hypothetical protein GCM10017673_34500 [Streptosporangium violaceochromogenes]
MVADEAHRELKGHEVGGAEPFGVGQGQRGDVGDELRHLTTVAHGDRHSTGEDDCGGEGEDDQHIRIVPQLPLT